jgi:type IV pilus assembly protein PilE
MDHPNALVLSACRKGRRSAGFTLIEVMIVVVIIGLLATLAVPSYLDSIRKARRGDAITRISQVQQAQERWRANNPAYGTLANVGVAATTADGHYTLSVPSSTATSYQILATATGAQFGDSSCRFIQLTMSGGNVTLASGATSAVGNTGAANNRCWNR